MIMPVTPLEYGTSVRIVSVDGIRADLLFFPGVEFMLDVEALCVIEVIHPVVNQRVFVPFFRPESVVYALSYERTRWHLLIDGPQIQVMGVESQNCLARFSQIVPDVSLAHFVVTAKMMAAPPFKFRLMLK